MDPLELRLATDRERIRALADASGGRIRVLEMPSAARPRLLVELAYATAGTRAYPVERRASSRLLVSFGDRYPFQAPKAAFETPVFHPNVFANGTVCLGTKWLASEGMDLFLQRVIRLMTFDPLLVNVHSAANAEALHWYQATRLRHPDAFPSERPLFGEPPARKTTGLGWQDAGGSPERVVVACTHCAARLRLPAGRSGHVHCPRCGGDFEART